MSALLWQQRNHLPWLATGVLGIPVLLIAVFAAIFANMSPGSGSVGSFGPSASALKDIPATYLRLYQVAGAKHGLDWTYLAAIGSIECNHGRTCGVSSAGALGPMQFMPATWRAYGNGGNVQDPRDAIPAAARYLKANGAPGDWDRAIFAYNHAGWYVAQVKAKAEEYRGALIASAGGTVEGSPKSIIDSIVIPMARACGIAVTVDSVSAANARHGLTVSGTKSDHQGPPNEAWAADMGNGRVPTPEMDKLARQLATYFKIPWLGSGLVTVTKGRYRFQLIYRTMQGGNHYNHVHFGVRLV